MVSTAKISNGWHSKRLKFVTSVNPKPTSTFDSESDEEVVFLPMENVFEDGRISQEAVVKANDIASGLTYFERGDIIVAKITPCFENGKAALLSSLKTPFGFGSTEFHTLRVNQDVSPKFIFYVLRSHKFRELGEASMTGSAGQKRIPSSYVENFVVALPEFTEQLAIANYLDIQTVQIDDIIAKKQKLIELLREERTAIINQAVTKGLSLKVKLKDSGIEWLGEIPEHWEVKRLKYLCKITNGARNTDDRKDTGEYPFFVRSQTVERIDSYAFDGEAVLTAGDGVGVGKVFHYYVGKFDFHQRVYMMSDFREIKGKLFYYFLQMNLGKVVFGWNAKATVDSLRLPMMLSFPIAYPGRQDEQLQIISLIEGQSNRIGHTISRIEQEIELLRQYRSALINEVVIGKIKVSYP